MSRSYKKHSVLKVYKHGYKKEASRAVRRYEGNIPNGKAFRKLFPTWKVYSQYYRETLLDVFERKDDILRLKYPTENIWACAAAIQEWEKFYYRK